MDAVDARRMKLLLRDCAAGFYQQMYFFGKDVSHPSGNKLSEYGFKRSPSEGLKGTSCYTFEAEELTIELYGACAALYTKASRVVFLRERCRFYEWLPEHKLVAGRWSQSDIGIEDPDKAFESLVPLLGWWLEYERWIEGNLGMGYREECYKSWKKLKSRPAWLAPRIARKWLAMFIEKQVGQLRPKHFV